jgi:hypothetical protein
VSHWKNRMTFSRGNPISTTRRHHSTKVGPWVLN